MLAPYISDLLQRRIVLGSSSPRRKEIFQHQLGLTNVEIVPSTFPETLNKTLYSPVDYVQSTCLGKTYELLGRAPAILHTDKDLLICADTIIEFDGTILEKPASVEAAVEMLKSLSNNTHTVHTCFSISTISEQRNFTESTIVHFAALDDAAIAAYVATGEPMDKAGGYGYQSGGASFVTRIEGDYYNVVGFPVHCFCKELTKMLLESVSD